jgi:integrase/recombinase XerD
MKQADIHVTGSCHLFRHAMATHMLDNGADIRFIQSMLGHEDLTSTEIYTHVSVEKLREVHRNTHPAKVKGESGGGDEK